MKIMKKILLIIAIVICAQQLIAQTNTKVVDERLAGLDQEIESLIKAYKAVGLSVAVVENNRVVYSKGFGYRDYNSKLPATSNTVFPIGSITKSFTAALLGILESQNKLSLKDKPSFHIPKLGFYSDRMNSVITIEDLLSHRSGIGNVDGTYLLFPSDDRGKLTERLKYLRPNGAVKDSWIYSNMGYVVAGAIVEKTTKHSWDNNVQEKIFLPLGMKSSNTTVGEMTKTNDYSLGYGISKGKVEKVLFAELKNDSAGGAINSTSTDMANWMLAWLNNGNFENKEIIPKDYIREATSIKAIDNGLPPAADDPAVYAFGYGYGWKINSNKGHYKVHHGGNVSGFSSNMALYPTDNLGIVVLTNQNTSILPYIVSDIITNRMLNIARTEWGKYPVVVSDINLVSKEIKSTNLEKKPTHKQEEYCGNFSNPGYGAFEVIVENNELYAIFPDFKFRLEHQYFNIFKLKAIKEIPQVMNPEFHLNFSTNNEGEISGVRINLETEPVEFLKRVN